jgi:hypothetical protein
MFRKTIDLKELPMPLLFILLLSCAGFAGVSETGLLSNTSLSQKAMGSPTLSDNTAYNEYDFCGSPLGLFEKESTDVRLSLAFRSLSERNSTSADSFNRYSNSLILPGITLGKRNVMYVMLDYAPSWVSRVDTSVTTKMAPLHRFGLVFAAQIPSKVIRFGVAAQGYVGSESTDEPASAGRSRTLMGVTTLNAYLGSQVHPLVRIGIHGGATGNLDSLEEPQHVQEDRFFYGTIPIIGGTVGFGKEGFPVWSNFSIDFATNNLVYVTKGNFLQKPDGNEDALLADSLAWKWETMGRIPAGGVVYQPSFSLEYMKCRVKEFYASEKNYPLTYGAERPDMNWTLGSFTFGLGASALVMDWGRAWVEWAHEYFSLSYGAAIDSIDKSRGYDRIGVGIEGNIHAIPALKMPSSTELFIRLGYCNMRTNGRFGPYAGDEFRLFNSMSAPSLRSGPNSPYHVTLNNDERLSRFTVGFGATFLQRMFEANFVLGFLGLQDDMTENGFEFGFGLDYNLGVAK